MRRKESVVIDFADEDGRSDLRRLIGVGPTW